MKILVNTADKERVVGIHFVGPNAGEVIQVKEILKSRVNNLNNS